MHVYGFYLFVVWNVHLSTVGSVDSHGFSVSLFQFDPKQLGILNVEGKKKSHHHKISHKSAIESVKNLTKSVKHNSTAEHIVGKTVNNTAKKEIPGNHSINAVNISFVEDSAGSHAYQIVNKSLKNNSSLKISTSKSSIEVSKLNSNPKPSDTEAASHLTNPILDAKQAGDTSANNSTNVTVSRNTTNAETKIKNELLFYKNRTTEQNDGSKKTTSLKLMKTTKEEPQLNPGKVIDINGTQSLKPTVKVKNNETRHNSTSANLHFDNAVNGTKINKAEAEKRAEILSHFIPTMKASNNLGRFHKKHNIYPFCYHCAKHSNYSDCIKRATIKKCISGLQNICFSKSHRNDSVITYEMGCTDHKKCKRAKAFPCKDVSESCFTCCQFDHCNGSPHHGDFETNQINLDKLTEEKKTSTQLNSNRAIPLGGFSTTVLYIVDLILVFLINR